MTYSNPEALVSTDWLSDHLSAPDVRVVDASHHLPAANRDPAAEYLENHIPGAVFFDIDDICDETSELPHMLPSPEKFASRVRKLGLGDGNRIVVYDSNGGFSAAARVWWMFRVFGHGDVAVLDGGLPKWLSEGRSTDDREPSPSPRHFTAQLNHILVRNIDQLRENIGSRRDQIVDARAADRFAGTGEEPRPNMRKGHIPGSLNLPYPGLMNPNDNFVMRPADELKSAFAAIDVDLRQPIAASCGSGVTAAVIALGLYLIGHRDAAVYDGSWTEWGGREDTPIDT
jgi:thiosulfate/3-mercaptopyruvate sulfurtransferase